MFLVSACSFYRFYLSYYFLDVLRGLKRGHSTPLGLIHPNFDNPAFEYDQEIFRIYKKIKNLWTFPCQYATA